MANNTQKRLDNATLEDVRIGFRNFAGREARFNAEGQRNFTIFLEPEIADQMRADGWNVKQLNQREEDERPQDILRVKVNYRGRPPRAVVITSKGKTPLDESMIDILDWADIMSCDVTIRPYNYDVNGRQGVTAYLQSIYVKIQEDYLDLKYDDVPLAVEPAANQEQLAIEDDILEAEVVEDDGMIEETDNV